ncbi:MAG: MEDS domain-containing protein [Dehalococcoidia bacterium]
MPKPVQATDELLDIKQAARVLQVSEVSLRRWTDAGRLPCMRVGGRRERRFRRTDLERFLEHQGGARIEDAPEAATSGYVELEDLRVRYGTHLCAFYETDAGRLKLGLPFLASGLRAGDTCFLVATPEAAVALRAALMTSDPQGMGPESVEDLIVHYGTRDPAEMDAYFLNAFLRETSRGKKCRVLGDMASFLAAGADVSALLAFEARYNQSLARQFPVLSLCQYDTRVFSAAGVIGALKCHEDTFKFPLSRFLGV